MGGAIGPEEEMEEKMEIVDTENPPPPTVPNPRFPLPWTAPPTWQPNPKPKM